MAAQSVAMVTQQLSAVSLLMGTSSDTPTHIHAQCVPDEQQFRLLLTHTHHQYMTERCRQSAYSTGLITNCADLSDVVVSELGCVFKVMKKIRNTQRKLEEPVKEIKQWI